jgi:hypothetical protein
MKHVKGKDERYSCLQAELTISLGARGERPCQGTGRLGGAEKDWGTWH